VTCCSRGEQNLRRIAIVVLVLMFAGLPWFVVEFIIIHGRINLLWNFRYSSDVVHGIVLSEDIQLVGAKCAIPYSNIKVVESFKGSMQSGQIFKVIGIQVHEYDNVGSEHFLLLKPFVAMEYPGFGDCKNMDLETYLVIHNWCCSIDVEKWRSLVIYDMLNSEQKGNNYFYPTAPVFIYLRWFKWITA